VPLWGPVVYLTEYIHDLTMDGHAYKTDSGYEFTGLAAEANMAPGVMDLTAIADLAGIGFDQVRAGVFDNARVYCFATTWLNPVEDEEPLGVAFMGKTKTADKRYTIELMMMIDALNQAVGKTYNVMCQKRFGGQEYAGCKVDLAAITVTGTLTGANEDRMTFQDTARTEAADWFGEGTLAFTTGGNAGLKPMEIKTYGATGIIICYEAFHYPVQIGDEYIMIPGCRKRGAEDCRDKWHNQYNFGGFPHIPLSSDYVRLGGQQ